MRIAHLSDLHLLQLDGAVPWRLFNKRFTGYLNLRLARWSRHRDEVARATARTIRSLEPDHVVITGDLTNLALEVEFDLARRFVEDDLGLPATAVSVVPGNHDVYTGGAFRSRRFEQYFSRFMTSDLPNVGAARGWPFVRLRGPVAIVGLSSALPRLPFVAAGALGSAQRAALGRILDHPEVVSRTPVLLQHHPWHDRQRPLHRFLQGLRDESAERRVLSGLTRGLVLHGHLHRRQHRSIPTATGRLEVIGTTSASLVGGDPSSIGGFNVYDLDDGGDLVAVRSFGLRDAAGALEQGFVEIDVRCEGEGPRSKRRGTA